MKRKLLLFLLVGLALSVAQIQPTPAAASLMIALNFEYSGGTPPEGDSPWITATFDSFALDTVRLTMAAANLTDEEFISEWYFNLNPIISPLDISVDLVINPPEFTGVSGASLTTGTDAFKAGPDGMFDLLFEFPTSNSLERFETGDQVVFNLIRGSGSLDPSDFNFLSAPGNESGDKGPFLSAAHIQGIGPTGNDSGWIAPGANPVPEPATMLLVGLGLIGLAGFGRRRFKS